MVRIFLGPFFLLVYMLGIGLCVAVSVAALAVIGVFAVPMIAAVWVIDRLFLWKAPK